MFARKKSGIGITLVPGFGKVNPARTFNVRRKPNWHLNILYGVKDNVPADHDEYDKKQQSLFDGGLPKPIDAQLFGPEGVLPPARPIKGLTLITSAPKLNFAALGLKEKDLSLPVKNKNLVVPTLNAKEVDVIQLSDDDGGNDDIMVVREVNTIGPSKASDTTLQQQRQHKKKVEKLAAFLKDKGIEESYLEVEKEKERQEDRPIHFMDDLAAKYMEVSTQKNRRKTGFMLRPNDPNYIGHLIDPRQRKKKKTKIVRIKKIVKRKKSVKKMKKIKNKETKKKKIKKQPKKAKIPPRKRTSSPILVHSTSDDDAPLANMLKKKTESKKKKPAVVPKKVHFGKFTKRTEEAAPKVALPASQLFVPKKAPKLRTTNINDYLRTKEAALQRQNLAKRERERRLKEEELAKRKKKADEKARIEAAKFRIPRKEGVPPPIEKSAEPREPKKKKVRLTLPVEQVDILGIITEAMDAHAAEGSSKVTDSVDKRTMKHADEFVLPSRSREEPMVAPSVPPRFGVLAEDDMDIANSSPEESPRHSREKIISQTCCDEGIEVERRARLEDDQSPRVGEMGASNEAIFKDQSTARINVDSRPLGDLLDVEQLLNHKGMRDSLKKVEYRLTEVDNVKKVTPVISRPPSSNPNPKTIPVLRVNKDGLSEASTDPRTPAPSLKPLSNWKNTRVELNLEGQDFIMPIARKEDEEDKTKKKKKGVKWGETATKEFDPDDRPIETDNKKEEEECIGEKEVGGRKYRIVRKKMADPIVHGIPKSCLKPTPHPLPIDPSSLLNASLGHYIPPPKTPPLDEYDGDDSDFTHMNAYRIPLPGQVDPTRMIPPPLSTIGRNITPKLPDFVPPPGYEMDGRKKDEEKERREKERKVKEEKERREKEKDEKEKLEKEKREKEEKEKREKEEKEKREKEDRQQREKEKKISESSNSSPDGMEGSSWMRMGESREKNDSGKMNQGASMGNMNKNSSSMPTFGGTSASMHLNRIPMRDPPSASVSYEKGSDIVGNPAPMSVYEFEQVKYQLDTRAKIIKELSVHQTIKDGQEKEYPVAANHPTFTEQFNMQERYKHELTEDEKNWKDDGIQPVWLQSLPYQTQFSFHRTDGLYWPVVQATDRIKDTEPDFESMDVLRQLGNNTHFATEKKALLGVVTRLPNGLTHKERFDAFFSGPKPEGRFKNRRMYSRVFSSQSEEEAREIHNERVEKERRLLREHEEIMKKNAPQGVRIKTCDMVIERPAGFRDFPSMIQYYKDDPYEFDKPFNKSDWYCNHTDYFLPYTERAGYLCDVINHFNRGFNRLYENSSSELDVLSALDKAAFASSQFALDQMEGCDRVAIPEDEYIPLLKRHHERLSLIESPSFDLEKYKELNVLIPLEQPYFHQIIDWLSSIYKTMKPISELPINYSIDSAFREIIMTSEETDRTGQPRNAREVFYEAYRSAHLTKPSNAKKSRSETDEWERYEK